MKRKYSDKVSQSKKYKFNSNGDSEEEKYKREKKKRHRKSSSSDSDSSSNSKRKKKKRSKRKEKRNNKQKKEDVRDGEQAESCFDVPISLMNANKERAPMTKEEWEKKQSVVKRIFDETSGRYRLIKGDGEVIEEIVSRDRHKEINQQATKGDGTYFQIHSTNFKHK